MSLKLGKKPATYDSRDIKYADVRPKVLDGLTLPPPPEYFGRGKDFANGAPPKGWGMMANGPVDDKSLPSTWAYAQSGAGDCTCADPAHAERMNAYDSSKSTPPTFSSKTVLDQYIYLTGQDGAAFNPATGANDNGLQIRSVLEYRRNTGFYDDKKTHHKIGIYVTVEPANWKMLREACWLFPGLSIGFNVPQSAIDQFNAGQIWSVVPGMMNRVVGGHDVPLVGHAPDLWTAVSWGQRQVMTYEFLVATCDEIWAYVDMERINKLTGETYNGYKEVDLEKYITLAGQQVALAGKKVTNVADAK